MAKYDGSDCIVLRVAGRNDPGYDNRYEQVWVSTEGGERMVLRSDVDESDDISDEEREAAEKALGKTDEQIRVDAIRRKARAEGRPPDETPAPTLTTATGRIIPNPDAIGHSGQAPVLEQEKMSEPTIIRPGMTQAISDRGDPSGEGKSAADADAAKAKHDDAAGDKATADQNAERERLAKEAEQRKQTADADASKADAAAGTQRGPVPAHETGNPV